MRPATLRERFPEMSPIVSARVSAIYRRFDREVERESESIRPGGCKDARSVAVREDKKGRATPRENLRIASEEPRVGRKMEERSETVITRGRGRAL